MTLRYEVTPGRGLVARHNDSVVWVGSELDGDAWDALGAVLDLNPGTDPSGADTAARLKALAGSLQEHPGTVFAALIVNDGQAQGILRGPVTVCNTSAVAPATGYEQFGITVPFPMSEAVFVGHAERQENSPSLAPLFDLDAGVVPAGGAWVHPSGSSSRHATNTGLSQVADEVESSSPVIEPELAAGPPEPVVPEPATPKPVTLEPVTLEPAVPEPAPPESNDATAQWSDPELAMLNQAPAQTNAMVDPAPETAAEDGGSAAEVGDAGLAAGLAVGGIGAAGLAAGGIGAAASVAALSAQAAGTADAVAGSVAEGAGSLPALSVASAPWAKPDVEVTHNDPRAVAGNDAFEPGADHIRIDLLNVDADSNAAPLPRIPTRASQIADAEAASSGQSGGVLVFDDGSTFALNQSYVLGRRPERHELVQSGAARPLTVVDPDTVLSGAHAAIRVHDGQAYLEDLGSLNGTHVAFPGETDWTRVEPNQPVRLIPGTRLLFGWTVATYSGSRDEG